MTTVDTLATRLVAAIPERVRADVCANVTSAIVRHWALSLRTAISFQTRGAGGWCDGVSVTEAGVILYRATGNRRQNFTLAHELAHYLVEADPAALSWLADRPEPLREIEHLCDRIASMLLIPRTVLDEALDGGPPSAATLGALRQSAEASRSACAVAVAQRLPCDGFVLVLEVGSTEVFFAARSRDTRPYAWRGDAIPAGHPLRQPKPPELCVAWWPYPYDERRRYFMSTMVTDGYVYAVLAENNLWRVPGLHFTEDAREDRGFKGTINCPTCGYSGPTRWWPHDACGESKCPRCDECGCDRKARSEKRVQCTGCFLSYPSHLVVGGLCRDCRD